jgi:carbamoyltransferase
MTTYLGVSGAHDSSVCFYKEGKIEYFSKEERITRSKRDKLPIRSLYEYDSEDEMVYCYSMPSKDETFYKLSKTLAAKKYKISRSYDLSNDHHACHASLAFYDSGFQEALVVVVDRDGSMSNVNGINFDNCRESESIYIANYPSNLEPIYKNYWTINSNTYDFIKEIKKVYPNCEFNAKSSQSIVKVYESATALILENILENGKTMGLSAYGNKDLDYENFFTEDLVARDYLFSHEMRNGDFYSINLSLNHISSKVTKDNYQPYADYAWQVQKQTQEALAGLIKKYIDKTGIKNVCLTGGYGLNVVANHYLIEQFPDVNFFFEPLADDSGNSLGAAMRMYRIETGDKNIYPLKDTFYSGKHHNLEKIKGQKVSSREVAELLSNGKSVAVFQGLSEAGPRSLGNRSILFDPRDKDAKDKVNLIKKREWYRPFAGMVLESDANIYFNMGKIEKSPFMTVSFPVKDIAVEKIPGVVHVDNTCRIQTVGQDNPVIFELLNIFKDITGLGVILNTSFNLAGEPLVETPDNALDTLKNSVLDYVWFPEISTIVCKDDIKEIM